MGPLPDDTLAERRKRLRFRAWRRGMREMDLLLGPFADAQLAGLDEADLAQFETLLDVPDQDLYRWLTGTGPIPPDQHSNLLDRVIACHRGGAGYSG